MKLEVTPVPSWRDGNKHYPLPADYYELDSKGQRQARVNALRQWAIPLNGVADYMRPGSSYTDLSRAERLEARMRRADALAAAVRFFSIWYLEPVKDPRGQIVDDPLFYGTIFLPTPRFHFDVVKAHAIHPYVAEVEPRGGGKTTNLLVVAGVKLVSRPGHEIAYSTASHGIAERVGERLKWQLYENSRLQDDWAPVYDGFLKPDKGGASQGAMNFRLRNRAGFFSTSIRAIQRGLRPDDYFLDDPEWDPEASTDMQIRRDDMEEAIFRIIMPMVQRPGSRLLWRGTFVSQRHYLWHAMENITTVVDGKSIMRASDPRFNSWKRLAVDIMEEKADGSLVSCWPEMWPVDDAEKERMKLPPETRTIVQIRQDVGEPAFMAEYRAKPGFGGAAYFGDLDPVKHAYEYDAETIDAAFVDRPTQSNTIIKWHRNGVLTRLPLRDFLSRYPTFITLDTSYTATPHSDFKVATCMAITDANELFVLDLWRGRTHQTVLVREAFRMADKWRAGLFPEVVKESASLVTELRELVVTRASDVMNVQHLANVTPLRIGQETKTAKISSLQWRFTHGKIKLPVFARDQAQWRSLFAQIQGFNPNAEEDGGLKHDDDIDTIAMSKFVVRTPRTPVAADPDAPEMLSKWRAGERVDSNGMPLYYSVRAMLTKEDIARILFPTVKVSEPPREII